MRQRAEEFQLVSLVHLKSGHEKVSYETHVYGKQRLDLFGREIQRGLVVRPSCIHDHPVKRTGLLNDFIHSGGDASFLCYIGLDCEDLVWETRRQFLEFITSFADVDGVDLGSTVNETTFCDTESDSSICTGDYCNVCQLPNFAQPRNY